MEDQVPVLDVEDPRYLLSAEVGDGARQEEEREQRDDGEHDEQCGKQTPRPPQVEPPEPDVVELAEVAEEEARDQVSADHEEDVDAEEPARHPLDPAVVEQHGHHGERPHAVERGDVPDARKARRDLTLRCKRPGHHTMVAHEALNRPATAEPRAR